MKKEKASIVSGWFGPICILSASTDNEDNSKRVMIKIKAVIFLILQPSIRLSLYTLH
jgi:hypothetical protein